MSKKNTYLNSNLRVDKLHVCWGARSAHFIALAAGYTPEVVHSATPSPSPSPDTKEDKGKPERERERLFSVGTFAITRCKLLVCF